MGQKLHGEVYFTFVRESYGNLKFVIILMPSTFVVLINITDEVMTDKKNQQRLTLVHVATQAICLDKNMT